MTDGGFVQLQYSCIRIQFHKTKRKKIQILCISYHQYRPTSEFHVRPEDHPRQNPQLSHQPSPQPPPVFTQELTTCMTRSNKLSLLTGP